MVENMDEDIVEEILEPVPAVANPPVARMPRKPAKTFSTVWDHFTKFLSKEGERMGRCNYCGQEYCADSRKHGTSALHNHLKACTKKKRATVLGNSQKELVFGAGVDGAVGTWKFNQENVRKSLNEMIINDEMSFKFVDSKGFRNFLSVACPRFKIPSRWTVARDCFSYYAEEKKKLKMMLKSGAVRVSLTFDSWTSVQRINYLALTAHWIDNEWKMQKKIINFCPITSHKGEAIGKQVDKCLKEWGIDSVFCITVDNAKSNDTAISYLKKKWTSCILGGEFLHMRCIAHVLNLIVVDGLEEMNVAVSRVRNAVKYIRNSPVRLAKFKECVISEKIDCKSLLCLDVCTRWNSTFLMLDTAQKFEKAFEAYEDVDPIFKTEMILGDGLVEKEDWENVRRLCAFLKKFYELTVKISGTSYVTCNLFLDDVCEVYCSLSAWENDDDLELSCMAIKMKEKFNKYWGDVEKMNYVLYFASILDPRKKVEYVRWCFVEMYGELKADYLVEKVRKSLENLFSVYLANWQKSNLAKVGVSSNVAVPFSEQNDQTDKGLGGNKKWDKFKKYKQDSGSDENKSDLDKYLSEDEKIVDDFDVLNWWKVNSLRFPVLSNMARDILGVPISTVASESAFSTGGRVLDTYRSSLTPKLVQALICTQDWLRSGSLHNDSVEDDMEQLEKVDVDLSKIVLEATFD